MSQINHPIPASERLLSLDALRGFDMCWILGLADVVTQLQVRALPGYHFAAVIAMQFEHVDWDGFRFFDLIFPLFLFLSGVSLAVALPRRVARDGRGAAVRHLLARAAIIFVLGVIYSGGLQNGWDQIRWLGVLQRIGIASAAAGLLSLWLGTRGLSVAAAALLVGYFLLLRFVPVPGVGAGNFAEGMNLTNYLDSIWLPGRKYDGNHDPEGILSTLPAIATALLGLLAGRWIFVPVPGVGAGYFDEGMNLTNYLDSIWLPGRKYDGNHDPEGILSTLPAIATALLGLLAGRWITGTVSPMRKVGGLILAGVVMLALGWTWHPYFPVIKKIWSSSFVLVAAGWSALLLGLFYWLVDVCGWRRGLAPFMWVGANPIALYLCSGFGFFSTIAERLVSPTVQSSVTTFAVMLATAWWLHRRQIFLRV